MEREKELNNWLKRKMQNLEIVLKEEIQYEGYNYFEDIKLIQNSLTPISIDEVSLSTEFLDKKLQFPITVAPMLGGHQKLEDINDKLGTFAKKYQIGIAVGDQSFGIGNESREMSYKIVRERNPEGVVMGNIGIRELLDSKDPIGMINECTEMIKADAIQIYINPLLDLIKNTPKIGYSGIENLLEELKKEIKIPIIIRSRGNGLSNEDIRQLWDLGIDIFDIEGIGGTDYARIETLKLMSLVEKQALQKNIRPFDFWGLPTLWSLLDIILRKQNSEMTLVVGGGIRNGIEATKALALGADMISVGYPFLIELTEDMSYPEENNLDTWFLNFVQEIKMTMVLLGAKNLQELREIGKNRIIILEKTAEWLKSRNLKYPPSVKSD